MPLAAADIASQIVIAAVMLTSCATHQQKRWAWAGGATAAGLVIGAAYWSLSSEFNQRAYRDIEVNLRTLALAFAETFPEAKIAVAGGSGIDRTPSRTRTARSPPSSLPPPI